jgi:phenylalanyl-tRNA synthetase beta chain
VKVLLSWLKEFVDVDASGEAIGAALSLRGFALEGIERLPDGGEVLDFDVTGNRPDCMNVLGLAREVAAAYGHSLNRRPELTPPGRVQAYGVAGPASPDPALPVEQPESPVWSESAGRPGSAAGGPGGSAEGGPGVATDIAITIDNPDLCPVYAGAVADVTVGPSPAWMQERLKASGIRPISNIVDITNYVLLELGQPMHAFDLTRLGGSQIRVRTAKAGERVKTLDGQNRELTPDMLVIADAEKPVAVAGVMGGADSEVNDRTTTIVFESAYFDPLSVRRTSRKLGLKTEASMRFEKGADRIMPPVALLRALTLLEEIGAGTRRGIVIAGHGEGLSPRTLELRRARIEGLLGTTIPDQDVFRIFGSLGFTSEPTSAGWTVTVPFRRIDVHREVDLIEELARHYGFDRIPSHFPALTTPPAAIDPRITRARQLRAVMTGAGFSEAVTFGFISAAAAAPFAGDTGVVAIANPLSETYGVLRPSALPGLLDAVAHNRRRQQSDVRLFEIGNRFTQTRGESRALACVWTGAATGTHWSGGARAVDFFDIKGLAGRICDALGLTPVIDPHEETWLAPGRAAVLSTGSTRLGLIGQIAPAITERHGIPAQDAVYALEIDLDAVATLAAPARLQVQPLPRFPSVARDISILVADSLPSSQVRHTITTASPAILTDVSEFDRYQGKGIPEGQISLSLRLTFQSSERTLTDAEVQNAMDLVLAALKEGHSAVQR